MTDWALIIYRINQPPDIRVYRKYGEAAEFVMIHGHKSHSILPVERVT